MRPLPKRPTEKPEEAQLCAPIYRPFPGMLQGKVAIGLELAYSQVSAVAADLSGRILARLCFPCALSCDDAYFRALGRMVTQLTEACGLDAGAVLGVGIGLPGMVTAGEERVRSCELPQIIGASAAELGRYIPFPTGLFHNAGAAAFAEARTSGDMNGAFYLLLSDNVSGALYTRDGGYLESGEVGHITLVSRGKRCFCGRRGCMNAYCGATKLWSFAGGDLEGFFRRLRDGDTEARSVWETYLWYLADAVDTLHTLYDGAIILGGSVGAHMGKQLETLHRVVEKKNPYTPAADYLRLCRCKTEAVALGAALSYAQRYLQSL